MTKQELTILMEIKEDIGKLNNIVNNINLNCQSCPVNSIEGRYFVKELSPLTEEISSIVSERKARNTENSGIKVSAYAGLFLSVFTVIFSILNKQFKWF
jgi:hypothetical protein